MKKICILGLTLVLFLSGCTTNNSNTSSDEPEYENAYLVEQMKEAFYNQDYSLFEEKAKNIQEQYPDSTDSTMAQIYLDLYENLKTEKEKEVENIDYKSYIQLIKAWVSEPNSAGGIDLYIKWKNVSDKTIKYITFTADLYNAVDDVVSCTIRNRCSFRGQVTGPIEPGTVYGDNEYWDCAWYNNTGKYTKITEIEIEYMDGTKIEIPQTKIDELFY